MNISLLNIINMKLHKNLSYVKSILLLVCIFISYSSNAQVTPPNASVDFDAPNAPVNLTVNGSGNAIIRLDNPNSEPINGVTLLLSYDPAVVQVNSVVEIDPNNTWIILQNNSIPGKIEMSFGVLSSSVSTSIDLFEVSLTGLAEGASTFSYATGNVSGDLGSQIASKGFSILDDLPDFIVNVGAACPPVLEIQNGSVTGSFIAGNLIYTEDNSPVIINTDAVFDSKEIILNKGFEVPISVTFETLLNGCN